MADLGREYGRDWKAWAIPLGVAAVLIGIIICLCGACNDDDDDADDDCTTSECREVDDDDDALKLRPQKGSDSGSKARTSTNNRPVYRAPVKSGRY